MARHNTQGKWGESKAVELLVREGYSIVDTNWHMGRFEIDIIALRDEILVFAEVKTRTDLDVDPLEAVDSRKIAHMVRSADAYLRHTGLPYQVRFDLFAINGTEDDFRIEHVPDAFYPPLKSYR